MKAKGTTLCIGLLMATLSTSISAQHQEQDREAAATEKTPTVPSSENTSSSTKISYQPPNLGAPQHRVGGGTRGICQLCVLAPAHTAITTQAQPRLYWFIAPGFANEIRFRLSETGSRLPLLEIVLPPNRNGGIQHLDLADYNLELEPDKLYEWSVMLEPQPHQRWLDLISTGRIILDPRAPNLGKVPAQQRPFLAARKGYWYDALDTLSRLLQKSPDKARWHTQRATLLEQGGLARVAAEERSRVKPSR